jgi:UPF0716 protein FxsA
MLFKLFLIFTLIPLLELYLLIKVGAVIGAGATILLVLGTGFAGAWLARMQGFHTMMKVRASLNQGSMPAEEMIDAVIILVAGVVLITPGLLTDAAGLLLLIPPTRRAFKRWLRRKFDKWIQSGNVHVTYYRH